jgi:ubiquinone/menaquinone biosynthesis C-methylase UbiE
MTYPNIVPRKRHGWEFCNENVSIWNSSVHPNGIQALEKGNRRVAKWFISVLKGCRRVIDIGCGTGFPCLYLAPHVDEIMGVDAAPNMINAAQGNAQKMNIRNVQFEIGGADGSLEFPDGYFDGALLCGVLENMEVEIAHRMISEVWRVLSSGGRLAVIDQDWQNETKNKPRDEWFICLKGEDLFLRHVQRNISPHYERYTEYRVNSTSVSGRQLKSELGDKRRVPTTITVECLRLDDIIDAWYDQTFSFPKRKSLIKKKRRGRKDEETVQFDRQTLKDLAASASFHDIEVQSLPVWSQYILFLTAIK